MSEELNEILEYIRNDAQKEIEAIRQAEKKELKLIKNDLHSRLETERKRIFLKAEDEAHDIARTITGGARLEIKKKELIVKRNAIERALQSIYDRFGEMSASEYRTIMKTFTTSDSVISALLNIQQTAQEPDEDENDEFSDLEEETEPAEDFIMEGDDFILYVSPSSVRTDVFDEAFMREIEGIYREKGLSVRLRPGEPTSEGKYGLILLFGPIEIDLTLDGIVEGRKAELEGLISDILFREE